MVSKTQESTQELPELARLRQRVSELETESLMLVRENQRLRQAASFSAVILDTASEVFVYYDSNLHILWLNNACGKILGKQPEELVGRPCHEVWWGTEEPCGDCPAMQARDTGSLVEAELTGSDQRIWQIRAYPVQDELGQVTGIIETGRDITHQESVGNALRASEERYRLLVDNANEGIMVAQDWRLPFVNRKVCEITGYSGEELTSRPFADFIHPDDREMVLERHGRRLNGEDFQSRYAFRVTAKDGDVRWLEISAVLFEWEGRPATLNFVDDVTERKRIDEAILRAKKEWERTFDTVPDLICILAADHTIRRINRAMAERLGMRPQDAVGRQCFAAVHGSEGPPLSCPHVKLVEDGHEHRAELEIAHLGGCFDVTVSPLRDENGVVTGSVHVARDITERRQAEAERLEMERRLLHGQKLESLGILAGGIAHDFNNLLMAIHGNLDLALHNLSPVSSARPNLVKAVQAAKRATDLTRQILAYSGRGQFIIGDVDLNELVLENSHLLRAAVSKNVTFSMQLGEGLPPIRADVGQIQQVVMNLITNGSEAIGEQAGILTLATGVEAYTEADLRGSLEEGARPGRFVFLEVTDTGCGMNSETRRRLVEPFFTTKSKGRGLGMAAVLGVVRGHDGAVFLESEPGKGTRVRVLFPQSEGMPADTDPAGDLPMEAPSPIKGSSTHGTILVVDDDPVVREVCRDMLEFIGYRVLEAEDGVDAVQVYEVRAGEIDGVILDYSMPRMDGVATLRELRRIRPEAKVILSSGYSEQETSLRFAGPGFDAFIQKPYHIKTLQRALQRLFQTG